MATKKKAARKVTAKKSPAKKATTKKATTKKATTKKATTKKAATKKAARRAPAQKTAAKKAARRAPAKKSARKAPAKKAARGGASPSLAPTERVPHLWLYDDRFDPPKLIVKQDQVVHVKSERDDDDVPVHVPECFGLAGPRPIGKRGTLILRVLPEAREGKYDIKAPPKRGDPHTDLKGEIEVVSKD